MVYMQCGFNLIFCYSSSPFSYSSLLIILSTSLHSFSLIVPFPPSKHPSIILKVKLVPVSFEDPDFLASFEQSAVLYARYQMAVHGDSQYECGESEVQTETCHIFTECMNCCVLPDVQYTLIEYYYRL